MLQDELLDALGPEHSKVKMLTVAGQAGRAIVDGCPVLAVPRGQSEG